jgi:hypothetical protein
MRLLSWLRRSPPPVETLADGLLGTLTWSDDEAGWVGESGGLAFSLARIRTADERPAPELLDYAKRVLGDPSWREIALDEAKRVAIAEYGPHYEPEIQALQYRQIQFYHRKTGPAIIADVGDGPRDRSWRIEFDGERCEGLGFDT